MTIAATVKRKSLEPFLKDDVEYYSHQTGGIRKLINMKSFILADDMGLGKSLQSLTLFSIDVKTGKAETCVIVCPVTLRDNWAEEIEKFTRLPYTLLGEEPHPTRKGEMRKLTPAKRAEQLKNWMNNQLGPRILICNYEQVSATQTQDLFRSFKFDTAIFDEAHMLKNPNAKRTKASLAIPSTRSFMLTGTPMLNQVSELWSLLHRIDPLRFPNYWTFVNRYCVFGGYEGRQIVGTKNQKELVTILGEVMLRRLKDDVLDRTKPNYSQIHVGLSKFQQDLYDKVVHDLVLNAPGNNGAPIDIENSLVKFLRAKQICGTPYSIDPTYPDDSLKLDRAVQVVEEFAQRGEKIVVFTQFRGVLDAFNKRLAKAGVSPTFLLHGDVKQKERIPTVHQWSQVKGPATLASILKVAGVGLNMTAASTVLFIDKDFVPGINKQGVDRTDRIGQTKPVQVIELIARGTIEQRVEEILRDKTKLYGEIIEGSVGMGKLLDALKERLKNDLR